MRLKLSLTFTLQLLLFVFPLLLNAQSNVPTLILRADDMGSSHSANLAIQQSYTHGIVTAVEVMAVTPWFPEAVKMLNDAPQVDVGLHLTLTSEWDNIKWRPLTQSISFTDADGFFVPMRSHNPAYPGLSLAEAKLNLNEIEKEFRAQIDLALKCLPQLSHLTDHMGCASVNDSVYALVKQLAAEYHLTFDPENVQSLGYGGPSGSFADKKVSFLAMLSSLLGGKTYLFLDHPGLDDPELRAVHHLGYEGVAADRQGVTDLFCDKEVREKVLEKGIYCSGYPKYDDKNP